MDALFVNGFPAWLLVLIMIWSIPWKGVALWKAAQLSHKKWFIILLVVNTLGILDIIYIRFVARKFTVETIEEK
jgi:methionyl-tRNA synthetase